MSRVLPILFNTEMVRAILDGRKTVTRRVIKFPKYIQEQENGLYTLFTEGTCYEDQHFEQIVDYLKKPYQPGDILYVRETYCPDYFDFVTQYGNKHGYKADYDVAVLLSDISKPQKWIPSIHMSKEAARIWLKVTDVRVERLQEVTGAEILAEGVNNGKSNPAMGKRWENMQRIAFENLWNSTLKKSDLDRYGWNKNPWVWVIEFERCEKPESEG